MLPREPTRGQGATSCLWWPAGPHMTAIPPVCPVPARRFAQWSRVRPWARLQCVILYAPGVGGEPDRFRCARGGRRPGHKAALPGPNPPTAASQDRQSPTGTGYLYLEWVLGLLDGGGLFDLSPSGASQLGSPGVAVPRARERARGCPEARVGSADRTAAHRLERQREAAVATSPLGCRAQAARAGSPCGPSSPEGNVRHQASAAAPA